MAEQLKHLPSIDRSLERATLKCALYSEQGRQEILKLVKAEDFYLKTHQQIFRAIQELHLQGEEIDSLLVGNRIPFKLKPALLEVVSEEALNAQATEYARGVLALSQKRKLVELCEKLQIKVQENLPLDQLQELASSELGIWSQNRAHSGLISLGDLGTTFLAELEERRKNPDRLAGWSCGLKALDHLLWGLRPSEVYVLAGRTAMGKTSLALHLALQAALVGATVHYYSLEMSAELLYQRLISQVARVDNIKLLAGRLGERDLSALDEAKMLLNQLDFWISEEMVSTITDLETRTREAKYGSGLDVLVVDYLQLMRGVGHRQNREQEIAEISRGLKMLAVKYNLVIIAVSQVGRAAEMGQDRRPELKDLRESGSIENDADVVIMIYRDDYYNRNSEERGMAELLIRKNRHGPCGDIKVRFLAEFTLFKNLEV